MNGRRLAAIAWLWLAAAVIGFALGLDWDAKPQEKLEAPNWELPGLQGERVRSDDFEGKVVVVNFWATWCPPCRDEIPGFIEAQDAFRGRGLEIVGIAMDEEGAAVVATFADEMEINYTVLIGDKTTAEAFGNVRALPTTFVIDRSGRVIFSKVGYFEKGALEMAVASLL